MNDHIPGHNPMHSAPSPSWPEPEPVLRVRRDAATAVVPTRATEGSAGLDLYAAETRTLRPGQRALVTTDVAVAIAPGWAGLVLPRSGLAHQHGLTVLNAPGLIDSDYRGPIQVLLVNLGETPFTVEAGMRIAQLLLVPCWHGMPQVVEQLDATARGAGGFGSTGR